MQLVFQAVNEPLPGSKWRALFEEQWPSYRNWFLKEGDEARPPYLTCVQMLRRYMPELMPTYERLVELAGGGDMAARCLGLYRPTPYLTGCSQAVWHRDDPALIRNYDYSPTLCEGVILHSAWNGRRVIAMTDCLWGVLDGMNEAGLAVSLSFGGRKVVGDGFGIPLVLRYILEFCTTTAEAGEVLRRVPSHMAYNVTLVDQRGEFLTAFVAPDRETALLKRSIATNHQRRIEWSQYAEATASLERERLLAARLNDPEETLERMAARFLEPPLFSTRYDQGWGTLYTAVYSPRRRDVEFRWRRDRLRLRFDEFVETDISISYGALG